MSVDDLQTRYKQRQQSNELNKQASFRSSNEKYNNGENLGQHI
jgi:hypothetical protein